VSSSRLVVLLAALVLLTGASAGSSLALAGHDPPPVVAVGTSVPGLRVELLGLSGRDAELTARFRVSNAGPKPLRSRVFGDPAKGGIDRQLGRDLGGLFPAKLQPGQTVGVSVTFQRPPSARVDVGFPKAVPFLQQPVD